MPPWPASHTAFVPWSDIEAVVLWEQELTRATMRYIGVARRPRRTAAAGIGQKAGAP